MSDNQMSAIADTLTEIRVEVAASRSATEEILKSHQKALSEHGNTLYGSSGQAGLRVEMAILQNTDRRRTWHLRTMWVAMVSAVIGSVVSFFRPH